MVTARTTGGIIALASLLLLFGLWDAAARAPADGARSAAPGIDVDDATTCGACHATVYAEWTESMHSRAHHDLDPIYGNMRSLRIERQGAGIVEACAACHTPRSAGAPEATSPAAVQGVSCAACHNVAEVHRGEGRAGAGALVYAGGSMLRSGRDLPAGAAGVHGTGPALPAMTDGETLCLACHDATSTPSGAPACTTGPEYARSASGRTCVDCHMPTEPGSAGVFGRKEEHVSHRFDGPHRAWYQDDATLLRSSLELAGRFEDDALVLDIGNLTGHGFPSGFPGRQAVLHVRGLDAAGEELWRNFRGNPMQEDPQAILNKVYLDAQGRPAPAAFAERLGRDNRLQPGERRQLRWSVPAAVVRAEVTVAYVLLPGGLARRLGLAEAVEAEPREIAKLRVDR